MEDIRLDSMRELFEVRFNHLDDTLKTVVAKLNKVPNLESEIKVLTAQVSSLTASNAELRLELNKLKSKPGQRWDGMIGAFIAATVSLVVNFLSRK